MSEQGTGYPQDRPADAYPGYAYASPEPVVLPAEGFATEHPQATLAFVLGLLSVLGLGILGPFGWFVGSKVVREIDTAQDGWVYTNRGLAVAGKVLGIIGTVFLVLGVALLSLFLVAVVLAART